MRLLVVTQAMDTNDPALGFFVGWVRELAKRMDRIEVICLYEGTHDLPDNVRVHSLGKERGRVPAITYAVRFKWLAWKLRHEYDAAFVHMNQEYILIAGPMWKLLGKRVFIWRNHYTGSFLTDIAAAFCDKVFCTSKHSYTATYRKTVLMPVGVDLARFHPDARIPREPRSVLFLARIAPSKRPDLFIDALGILIERGISFIASVYGSPLPADTRYYESLKQRVENLGLHGRVRFHSGIPNEKTPDVYRAHELFVNCSPSGMLDKTIFEAAACGTLPVASSEDYPDGLAALSYAYGDADALASALERLLASAEERARLAPPLAAFIERNSLDALATHLAKELAI